MFWERIGEYSREWTWQTNKKFPIVKVPRDACSMAGLTWRGVKANLRVAFVRWRSRVNEPASIINTTQFQACARLQP